MVRRKITYYKMLMPERYAENGAAVGSTDLRSQACFAAGQSPSSLEPSYEEEEADPMFMAEVAVHKAPMGMRRWTSTSCRRPSPPWSRRTSGSTWRY